ncbi:MAG: choice-of-anchor J domain-containing protein [Clostridia bacterium]|nr:choice-of-anchor J domain-containing protein [Clostridia bacterium]
MKRVISILAAAAMLFAALPAFAEANEHKKAELPTKEETVASWDFETDPIEEGWIFVDGDGDGINWEVSSIYASSGSNSLCSYSYLNNVYYEPENWAITPAVTIPDEGALLRFVGRNYRYTGVDIFRIYAGTSPDISEMSPIAASMAFNCNYDIPLAFETKEVDVSAFAGQTVYFAFRHYITPETCEMGYMFFIDDVEIVTDFEPIAPPPQNLLYGCYFNDEEDMDEWQFVDGDDDGFGWELTLHPGYAYEGVGVAGSESYITDLNYGGPTTPDNWLISPAITLPSDDLSLTFYAEGLDTMYDAYWREHFSVYAGTSIDNMSVIIPETETTNAYQLYSADLSDYANQTIYIAIRHHNCYGENLLSVDSFEVWGSGEYIPVDPDPTPTTLYGDVNLNGVVEIEDSLMIMRWLICMEVLNEDQLDMAEVQGDELVSIDDALLVMRYAIGTIPYFPREIIVN